MQLGSCAHVSRPRPIFVFGTKNRSSRPAAVKLCAGRYSSYPAGGSQDSCRRRLVHLGCVFIQGSLERLAICEIEGLDCGLVAGAAAVVGCTGQGTGLGLPDNLGWRLSLAPGHLLLSYSIADHCEPAALKVHTKLPSETAVHSCTQLL